MPSTGKGRVVPSLGGGSSAPGGRRRKKNGHGHGHALPSPSDPSPPPPPPQAQQQPVASDANASALTDPGVLSDVLSSGGFYVPGSADSLRDLNVANVGAHNNSVVAPYTPSGGNVGLGGGGNFGGGGIGGLGGPGGGGGGGIDALRVGGARLPSRHRRTASNQSWVSSEETETDQPDDSDDSDDDEHSDDSSSDDERSSVGSTSSDSTIAKELTQIATRAASYEEGDVDEQGMRPQSGRRTPVPPIASSSPDDEENTGTTTSTTLSGHIPASAATNDPRGGGGGPAGGMGMMGGGMGMGLGMVGGPGGGGMMHLIEPNSDPDRWKYSSMDSANSAMLLGEYLTSSRDTLHSSGQGGGSSQLQLNQGGGGNNRPISAHSAASSTKDGGHTPVYRGMGILRRFFSSPTSAKRSVEEFCDNHVPPNGTGGGILHPSPQTKDGGAPRPAGIGTAGGGGGGPRGRASNEDMGICEVDRLTSPHHHTSEDPVTGQRRRQQAAALLRRVESPLGGGGRGGGRQHPTRGDSGGQNSSQSNPSLSMVYSDDTASDDEGGGGGGGHHHHHHPGRQHSSRSAGSGGGGGRGGFGPPTPHLSEELSELDEGSASHSSSRGTATATAKTGGGGGGGGDKGVLIEGGYRLYRMRWVMLFYMSSLNLLSDWTCYSVAPIATLTSEEYGKINPESLVVVFLGANAVATASEPMILSRLGLRRTIILGAFLLMVGSVMKSGIPYVLPALRHTGDEWKVYLGFFLVGLSQPLYQCTPALLSGSWFPEKERTMATGVALNSNQLGIGCAFVFGTLLVGNASDIPRYFGLMSALASAVFVGCVLQFDDAPPTPPSETARVIRGTFTMPIPNIGRSMNNAIWRMLPRGSERMRRRETQSGDDKGPPKLYEGQHISEESSMSISESKSGSPDRDNARGSGFVPPSNANDSRPVASYQWEDDGGADDEASTSQDEEGYDRHDQRHDFVLYQHPMQQPHSSADGDVSPYGAMPAVPPGYGYPPSGVPPPSTAAPPYQQHYAEPPDGVMLWSPNSQYHHHYPYLEQSPYAPPHQQTPFGPYDQYTQQHYTAVDDAGQYIMLPKPMHSYDEGAEPISILTQHHLKVEIADDQIWQSTKACFSRSGFPHALCAFTVSAIVINTLSTFMDYLVRLGGAGREMVGIVGGTFQLIIMMSSLIVGKQTDKTRAYYSVVIGLLVLGAFGLAECGVNLDQDRGGDLRWTLLVVAALVGPLQPVATELGVEVAYPLSENTVLVIQQLFANLLSASFIPFFKALKDVGRTVDEEQVRPEYTFSFYLLIVLHASATVFFATFNGQYLRLQHEQAKKNTVKDPSGEHAGDMSNREGGAMTAEGMYHHPVGETHPLLVPTSAGV